MQHFHGYWNDSWYVPYMTMNCKYNSVPILRSHKLSTFEFRITKGNGTNCFPLPSLPPVSSCPLYCNRVVYGNEGKDRKETNVWLCSISVLVTRSLQRRNKLCPFHSYSKFVALGKLLALPPAHGWAKNFNLSLKRQSTNKGIFFNNYWKEINCPYQQFYVLWWKANTLPSAYIKPLCLSTSSFRQQWNLILLKFGGGWDSVLCPSTPPLCGPFPL